MATSAFTKRILDKALELGQGEQLYINCDDSRERDSLFGDLQWRRMSLIGDEKQDEYESLIIYPNGSNNTIVLRIIRTKSVQIRKLDSTRIDVQL